MSEQPALFSLDPSIAEQFATFNDENPAVYAALVRLAREWVASTGRHKLGIKTLFERTRWEIAMTTTDPDFKLNNNFTAYYARLIMLREPDLAEMFTLRRSAADEQIARAS